jgi:hypothetical protein
VEAVKGRIEVIIRTKPAEFADQLSSFRTERLGIIREGKVPGDIEEGARFVVHIVPADAFDRTAELNFTSFRRETDALQPLYSWGSGPIRHNFDGMVNISKNRDLISSYVQLFRTGIIEAVNTTLLERQGEQQPTIPGTLYEREVLQFLLKSLPLLKELGVQAPLFVLLSLLGVKGYTMGVSGFMRSPGSPVDRDELLVPEVKIEGYDTDIPKAIRPAFDRVWNAAGWPRSPNYDEEGNWKER